MGAPDPIEKKLDRYYEDLMDKLLEIIDYKSKIFIEQKEIKKEIAKLKEMFLKDHIQSDTGREVPKNAFYNGNNDFDKNNSSSSKLNSTQTSSLSSADKNLVLLTDNNSELQTANNSIPTQINPQKTSFQGPTATSPIQNKSDNAPTPAPKTLKEFLAQEISIFDVNVLNAFIKSTKEILKKNTGNDIGFIKPRIEEGLQLPIIVAGKMHLTREGGNKGSMAFCLEQKSAYEITRNIFHMNEETKPSQADIGDVTSEICNQICGKSKLLLKNSGYTFDIGLPEIQHGNPAVLMKNLSAPRVTLQFEYNKNPFYIFFWG